MYTILYRVAETVWDSDVRFDTREDAEEFIQKKGGQLAAMEQARKPGFPLPTLVVYEMKNPTPCPEHHVREFVIAKTKEEAAKLAPWAKKFLRFDDGFYAFSTAAILKRDGADLSRLEMNLAINSRMNDPARQAELLARHEAEQGKGGVQC